MKISELMLDMGAGDASVHDVKIQQAAGKIAVSTAIYEAAAMISEMPANTDARIIQEAANAGLPTNAGDACTAACEAVKQDLAAYLDIVAETAKKINDAASKELKLFTTIGKKFNIGGSDTSNFTTAFAAPFAKAVIADAGDKKITLDGNKFLKSKFADKLAANYCKGMVSTLGAYGADICSDVFSDSTIISEYGRKNSCQTASTFKEAISLIETGSSLVKFDKVVDKDRHYTDTIKENDVEALLTDLYIITTVSKAVVDAIGKPATRKSAVATMRSLCDNGECTDKKLSKVIDNAATSAKDWSDNMTGLTDAITKAFGDSSYTLMESINRAK